MPARREVLGDGPMKERKRALGTILYAWLLAGTLDITAASVYYPLANHFRLILLFQNIASGVFGDRAFAGGIPMALIGLMFHYLIALTWTIFFFLISPRIKIASRNRFVTGMIYGIFVWLVMNLIVLPLSNVEHSPLNIGRAVVATSFLMFCIGLPISMIVGSYFRRN